MRWGIAIPVAHLIQIDCSLHFAIALTTQRVHVWMLLTKKTPPNWSRSDLRKSIATLLVYLDFWTLLHKKWSIIRLAKWKDTKLNKFADLWWEPKHLNNKWKTNLTWFSANDFGVWIKKSIFGKRQLSKRFKLNHAIIQFDDKIEYASDKNKIAIDKNALRNSKY